jgi:hypothetical protein
LRAVTVFVTSALALLALLSVWNSFTGHITPDNSVYLMHARTFIRHLDRFKLSFDSKGFMQTVVLAPAVALFGANMVAAATAQLAIHLLGLLGLYGCLRFNNDRAVALILTLASLGCLHSHRIWGGNARPEDFAFGYVLVTLYAVMRGTPRWRFVGGAMAAVCFLTKTSLLMTPAALLLVSGVVDTGSNPAASPDAYRPTVAARLGRNLLWPFLGFCSVLGLTLTWLLVFDSLSGWFYQSIRWPMIFKQRMEQIGADPLRTFYLFKDGRLHVLLLGGLAGLAVGLAKGPRRSSLLIGTALLSEFARIMAEGAAWPYLLIIVSGILLLAANLLFVRTKATPGAILSWAFPIICLLPQIIPNARAELEAFELRTIRAIPTPYEYLAAKMSDRYREGETVFVAGNDYQIVLMLNAPPPHYIPPRDFGYVSPNEQERERLYYRDHPPDWIVRKTPDSSALHERILGGVDFAYHVYVFAEDSTDTGTVNMKSTQSGNSLNPFLSPATEYRLEIDTGYVQAWRLLPAAARRSEMGVIVRPVEEVRYTVALARDTEESDHVAVRAAVEDDRGKPCPADSPLPEQRVEE